MINICNSLNRCLAYSKLCVLTVDVICVGKVWTGHGQSDPLLRDGEGFAEEVMPEHILKNK